MPATVTHQWRCGRRHVLSASLLLIVLCLSVLVINVYELRLIQAEHAAFHVPPPPPPPAAVTQHHPANKPIVWLYGKKVSPETTV